MTREQLKYLPTLGGHVKSVILDQGHNFGLVYATDLIQGLF